MKKHFVTFVSPGTFFSETSEYEMPLWDIKLAIAKSEEVFERYGATPFGFFFTTRERTENDLDSKEVSRSPMYYLGGKVETYEEIVARNDPSEEILRSNMRINNYKRVIVNSNSYKATLVFNDNDVVLETPIK